MRRLKTIATVALWGGLALAVTGCSGGAWLDSRREAGQETPVGETTEDQAVVCYDGSPESFAEANALARQHCAASNRTATYIGSQRWQCRMTTPHRALYDCR